MKKLKLYVLTVALVLCIAVPARALVPVVLYLGIPAINWAIGASLALHTAAASLYFYHTNGSNTVDSEYVKGVGRVEYVDISDINAPKTMVAPTVEKMSNLDAMNAARADTSRYPQLADAASDKGYYSAGDLGNTSLGALNLANEYVQMNDGKYYKMPASIPWGGNTNQNPLVPQNSLGTCTNGYRSVTIAAYSGVPYPGGNRHSFYLPQGVACNSDVPKPVGELKTPQEFADKINSLPAAYSGEIDDMIKSNPNIVDFQDETGQTITAPPNTATAAQIDAIRGSGESTTTTTSTSAPSVVNHPGGGSTTTVVTTTGGGAGNGGTTTTTTTDTDGPDGTGNKTGGTETTESDDPKENATIIPGTVPAKYGDGTKYNLGSRFKTFTDEMKESPLFQAPNELMGDIPGTGNSSMYVSFGRFGSCDVDLGLWFGSSLSILKFFVLFICTVSAIRIVTKGGA